MNLITLTIFGFIFIVILALISPLLAFVYIAFNIACYFALGYIMHNAVTTATAAAFNVGAKRRNARTMKLLSNIK